MPLFPPPPPPCTHTHTQSCLSGMFSCPVFGGYSGSCVHDPGQSYVRLPFCLRTCLWFSLSLRVSPNLIYRDRAPGSVSAEPSTPKKRGGGEAPPCLKFCLAKNINDDSPPRINGNIINHRGGSPHVNVPLRPLCLSSV